MFADTITVDDASGDDIVYALVTQDSTGTRRLDVATTLAAPGVLSIKHSSSGKGTSAVDRHLVSIARTIMGSDAPITLTLNFTIAVPRDVLMTNQIIYDAIANLLDFVMAGGLTTLTTTTVDGLLRGES